MNLKRFFLETATLVGAAALCAFVSNQSASRERRLALPGDYKDATTVPTPAAPATPLTPAAPLQPETAAETPTSNTSTPAPAVPNTSGIAPPRNVTGASAPRPARPPESVPARPGPMATGPGPAAAPAPEPLARRFPPHPDKPFVEVAGDDVLWLHSRGALFLDARRTSVFSEGHIALARPFSVWEADVDDKILALLGEGRNQQEPIVVYCSGGDCEDSHMLAQKLFGTGFDNVLVYRDGWPDWQKRGGPSRMGSER